MLLFLMSLMILATVLITQGVILLPIDSISSLQLPNWIGLVVLLVVLSWCLGE